MIARRSRQAAKLMRLIADPTCRRGLRLGVAAAVEHLGALRTLAVGCVIDVGANAGQFSLAVRAVHPKARIIAVEPLPAPAATYRRLFENDSAVTLHAVAAGAAPGEAEIHVSRREDSSSLLPITQAQGRYFPGTEAVARRTIQVARLDDLQTADTLTPPILIKLDVQGFELEALEGMPRLLAAAQAVYVEVSFIELYAGQPLAGAVVEYLARRGFALAGVYNLVAASDGSALQADFLFRRSAAEFLEQPEKLAL